MSPSVISKKALSERDICTRFITPAILNAEWDIETQVLEEKSFTDGKIYVKGKLTARGKRKAGRLHPLLQAKYSYSHY